MLLVYIKQFNIMMIIQLVIMKLQLILNLSILICFCAILPPKDLYLPVLPHHVKVTNSNKLVFGSCRTCIVTRYNKCDYFKYKINNIKEEQIIIII